MDDWKSMLPKGINVNQHSLDECRSFKHFHDIFTQDVGGPPGFRIFHHLRHHLLCYAI